MREYGRIDAIVSNMGHGGAVPEAIKTVGFDPDFDGPLLELSDALWHEKPGYVRAERRQDPPVSSRRS